MDKQTFQELLTKEVESYKSLLETKDNDWIVKGFIDVNNFNAADAKKAGIGKPRYNNLETYKAYLDKQQKIRKKLKK